MDATGRPITVNGDLANPPAALAPLVAQTQWCVWKWTQKTNGSWQKPPFVATAQDRHASTIDPATWNDYATSLATVHAKRADGLTYILTADDPFGAVDVDHCRNPATGTITGWAQQWLDQAIATYVEITPSGTGLRIWGTVAATAPLHTNDSLDTGGRLELFRHSNKALTITGRQLGSCDRFSNIDALLDRAAAWAKRHKASAAKSTTVTITSGTLSQLSIDDIEQIVREGAPPGGNRSDLFHAIVGHYSACGWSGDQIAEHFEQFPDGISGRYQAEGRLRGEINRCLTKWEAQRTAQQQFSVGAWSTSWQEIADLKPEVSPQPAADPELAHDEPDQEHPEASPEEADREEADPDAADSEEASPPLLPPIYCHGDPDPRPLTSWLVKNLLASVSYGVLAGQWGTGKTFMVFELSACLMTGQPFVGHRIKRQCGALYIAAEGVSEVRKRLNALVQEKCGGMQRAPFRWYESAPTLLGPAAAETLIAMAKQAEASLQQEFGLPLGLVVIDTVAASAGYAQQGAESDAAVACHIIRVFAQVATACSCVVLGVDHFGKNVETGTRGSSAKEANAELVLACLGEREQSGRMVNTRLAIRKNRAGPQGQEYRFTLREVELGLDEDGDRITTMVVDWQAGPAPPTSQAPKDPWERDRQTDTRQAMLLLKRVLMSVLAKDGADLPVGPDGPTVRMVDQEIVRQEFYDRTAADGTEEEKRKIRAQRFRRAVGRAEEKQLVGLREIEGKAYLWLEPNQPGGEF
jgi:hypothetical protein